MSTWNDDALVTTSTFTFTVDRLEPVVSVFQGDEYLIGSSSFHGWFPADLGDNDDDEDDNNDEEDDIDGGEMTRNQGKTIRRRNY